jgi:two-component system cell cycle sensor histidine kinase/response regulator CckA
MKRSRQQKRKTRDNRREGWPITREHELLALYHAAAELSKATSFDKACRDVAGTISKHTGFEIVTIERYDRQRDMMELLCAYGISTGKGTGFTTIPAGETLSGTIVRNGRPLLVSDIPERKDHDSHLQRKLGVNTFVGVPLKANGKTFGVLSVASQEARNVNKTFLRFLATLATEISLVMGRLEAEEHTRGSEERYRQLFINSIDAIFILDPSTGAVLDVNPQATTLVGFSQEELIGKSIFTLHPEREHRFVREAFAGLKQKGQIRRLRTTHLVAKNGKEVPVEINARIVAMGGKKCVLGLARDITEEKKAEVKLTASEELLRIIVEGTPDVFFYVHDTKGILTYVSPSIEKMTGHSAASWKSHYSKYMTGNPINTAVKQHTERALNEGVTPPQYLCEISHADGHPLLLEINEKPIFRDGKVIGLQGVAKDITERKRLEEAIIQSRDYLDRIISQTPLAIQVFDAAGKVMETNEAYATLLEHHRSSERQHSVLLESEGLRSYVSRAFRGETVDIPEFTIESGDAGPVRDERMLRGKLFPVFDRHDKLVNVVAMLEDVTEKHRLEEQLLHSQKMESIGLLAGGVAHDFNNILGGILGYASYLKSVVPATDRVYAHIDTIERSALRAAELTSKLLAFARGGKYVVKPVDVNTIVDEVLRLLKGSLDKSIRIEEELDKNIPAVEGDAGQIQQIFMNICVNARDAMPGGGILHISTTYLRSGDAFLSFQSNLDPHGYVKITISDTGMGIEKALISRIFEPFFTTKEKGKGTGLGLATVYGIVKNHEGFVDVQSEIGVGTTFAIYLPAVMKQVEETKVTPIRVHGGQETVLVVDDEEVIRSLVRDALATKGYRILEASHGKEALDLYKTNMKEIDLVILDMAMPVMGGRETFVRLKAMNDRVKAILSTGYSEDERARELMGLGVKAFVHKPYRVEELAAAVRKVLDDERPTTEV